MKRRRHAAKFGRLVPAFAVAVACGMGCAERPESLDAAAASNAPVPTPAPNTAPAQPREWLSRLRALHALADAVPAPGRDSANPGKAELGALEAISEFYAAPPPPQLSANEILPLRRDLADRAARIELARGKPREALSWTGRGLSLSDTPGVFRANLLLTAAEAHEALGQTEAARSALLQALQVNQSLLDQEVENP